jgi:glycosyltransferase involved in cell wall biosynthesis
VKVSIITATYNSAATIRDTLASVAMQTYKNIEHIIVDGLSTDNTLEIVKEFPHVAKVICEKDSGLYDAINKGIQQCTGDVVGILNSDDFFPTADVVAQMQSYFTSDVLGVYSDIAFVKPNNLQKIVRYYSSKKFEPSKFKYGYMPAHPSFYTRKSCFDQFGYYFIDYKIAADYELLMRFIYTHKIKTKYIPITMVYMRTGGVSNQSIFSRWTLNKEIVKACAANGVYTNMLLLSLKYFNKIGEFIKPRMRFK